MSADDKPATGTVPARIEASPTATAAPTETVVIDPTSIPETTPSMLPSPTAVPTSTPTTVPVMTATPVAEQEPVDPFSDLGDFEAALNELVRDADGTVAVSLALPDGTVLWELNADESMEAASLYKVPVMVEVYRQQTAGLLSMDDAIQLTEVHFNEGEDSFQIGDIGAYVDVESLVTAMITQSSNVAAYALLELVGSANVNATMADLGLDGIEIRWSPQGSPPPRVDDPVEEEVDPGEEPVEDVPEEEAPESEEPDSDEEVPEDPAGGDWQLAQWLSVDTHLTATVRGDEAFNVIQASDLAQLLVMMLNGSVVNEAASQEMLDLLGRQEIYGGLPALLPEGTVAHKTGYLVDGVVNDAGVVYTPHGPIVAVVLTEDVGEVKAYEIASQIGLMVYQLGAD